VLLETQAPVPPEEIADWSSLRWSDEQQLSLTISTLGQHPHKQMSTSNGA
jgi:hypothetical protein